MTVIGDESQFSKFVHEKADAGAGGSDHFGKHLLANLGDDWFGPPLFSEIGKQKQSPRQAFFAGIERLIDQILLDADGPGQK